MGPSSTLSVLQPIETYRAALESIAKEHLDGASGSRVVAEIAAATDALLLGVVRAKLVERGLDPAPVAERMCLVALGGYGRKEMHPQSDIDVMFLFPHEPDDEAKELVSDVLRALFDARLQVGNVTRDFATALAVAREDLQSLTAMLEGRLLWGDAQQYERFCRQLARFVQRHSKRLITQKIAERACRLARHGNTINIQEPNLKDSPGGLRDYHHGLWLASLQRGWKLNLAQVYRAGLMDDREYRALQDALELMWRLRTDLHLLTRTKSDLVSMHVQQELAARLKYQDREDRLAEEILMRDYYRAAFVTQEFADHLTEQLTHRPVWRRLFSRVRSVELGDGFTLRSTEIDTPLDLHFFENVPQRLLDLFVRAVQHGATLTRSAAVAVHENRNLIDDRFRSQEETARKIRTILRWPGRIVPVLRIMRRLGILHRLFPEWRGIANLARHDLHHRYTIDEHTLLAMHYLETLHEDNLDFAAERGALWRTQPDRDVLRLATLFHDIGKGRGGDHCEIGAEIVDEIAARLRFSEAERADVRFLVSRHIMLSHRPAVRLDRPGYRHQFRRAGRHARALGSALSADACGHEGDHPRVAQ
jgi:[protein-PII] uridylyltransferase